MTSHKRLYKDMIRDSRLWNLYLAIGRENIDVMAYCAADDRQLFIASIDLDSQTQSISTAVEEAVYDNPLLLNDFNKVTVISRDNRYGVIPECVDEQLGADIVRELTGADERSAFLIDSVPLMEVSIGHFIDCDLYNFLCRTFAGIRFIHRLSVLVRYYHGTNRGSGAMSTFVNMRPGEIDIVMHRADKLLLANTYNCSIPADSLYYIMAVRQAWGVDPTAPVILAGDRDARNDLTPLLRQYAPTVMPFIFPAAMFRAGGQEALNAPTDITFMPLCE